jgi:hypothetical protein
MSFMDGYYEETVFWLWRSAVWYILYMYENVRGVCCILQHHLPSCPTAPFLMSTSSLPSAANSFCPDVYINSFRNVDTHVLNTRCYIPDDSVIGRSVVHFFSDPTQDGRKRVDKGPVDVHEGSNYVFLVRTHTA